MVGHGGQFSAVGYHRLGQHFTPILIIWLPLIWLLGKWALPIVQVSLLTGAGLLLYRIAQTKLDSRLSKRIVISFYCANAVIGPCLGNFTDLSQLPICFFALLLGFEKRISWLFWLACFVMPLIREDAGVLLVGIGIWMFFRYKEERKVAIALILYGSSWVLLVTNLIMPLFSEDNSKRFMVENF